MKPNAPSRYWIEMKIISPDPTKASPLYSALFKVHFFISIQNFRDLGGKFVIGNLLKPLMKKP